ncbi:MAG: hypothetical protein LBV20_00020 [Treponema sp.]|jgi:hypothetical protein|nr:hypothetical protein [Treponema sp.]
MLVINGFFEDGVFIPDTPIAHIKGRQRANLNIEDTDKKEKDTNINTIFDKYLYSFSSFKFNRNEANNYE